MRRALRPGGTAVVLNLRRDASSRAINDYVATISDGPFDWLGD